MVLVPGLANSPWSKFHGGGTNNGTSLKPSLSSYGVAPEWTFRTGNWVYSRSSNRYRDGTVYIGSDDGALYAIDPNTGFLKWLFTTHGVVRASPAVAADGMVYIASERR